MEGDSEIEVFLMRTPLLRGGKLSWIDSFAGSFMDVVVEAGKSLELMVSLLLICWSTPVGETGGRLDSSYPTEGLDCTDGQDRHPQCCLISL
jgi:hypothetical protein